MSSSGWLDLPRMTVRTLAISCMTLYRTLESASWPKPRWNVAGAKPTVWGLLLVSRVILVLRHSGVGFFLPGGAIGWA